MTSTEKLSKDTLERIEKNRKRAITIRNSKLLSHPYSKTDTVSIDKKTIKIGGTKYKDSGGGFLIEDSLEDNIPIQVVQPQPPIIEPDRPHCEICNKPFSTSWLFDNFLHKCCDECKDTDTLHKLITKTEAINTYLLKDCDFDKRGPPLKYIRKQNPHNVRWGEMKLYLECQVEKRALEVWGSKDKIEEERENREEKKVLAKTKKYQKQLKELRMSIRSSLYDRTSSGSHVHEFGEETYNEEDDTYTKTCNTCSYTETFEKM